MIDFIDFQICEFELVLELELAWALTGLLPVCKAAILSRSLGVLGSWETDDGVMLYGTGRGFRVVVVFGMIRF
jgi:hypothetical protein